MDSLAQIGVFVRVVDLGGFTRAAGNLGLTPSGVSRIVSRLEERLGVRLLNRTTRSLSLTDEGAAYHNRCTRIIADLEAANASLLKATGAPRGRLRVDVPVVLADFVVGPSLPSFLTRYPDVSVELTVRDKLIDSTAEGVDVVIRLAPSRESELVSRRLARARSMLVASPRYISQHGRPRTLTDLREHSCIVYLSSAGPLPWRLKQGAAEVTFAAKGRLLAGSGNVLTQAVVAGFGIAQTFEYHIARELASGQLVPLLEEFEPAPRIVQALFAKHKATLPKVRVFVEFLAELFSAKAKARRGRR